MRPPHSRGDGDASGSEATAAAASISKEVATVDWREIEVAHDPKKFGIILRYSDLGSGHPLVQRHLCTSKCIDNIHNSS